MEKEVIKVALVQATTHLNDLDSTLKKTYNIIDKCAAIGAQLVVFSQSFLPCHPIGFDLRSKADKYKFYKNNIALESEGLQSLKDKCAELKINLSIGISEYSYADDQVYNTNLIIDNTGEIIGKHRSNLLIGEEKLIWQTNREVDFKSIQLPFREGKAIIGSLINYENYNPLARSYILMDNIDIYIAPNSLNSDKWQASLKHLALESKAFIISANQIDNNREQSGGSAILNPLGEYVVGPVYNQEGILVAELDLELCQQEKIDYSPAGIIKEINNKTLE